MPLVVVADGEGVVVGVGVGGVGVGGAAAMAADTGGNATPWNDVPATATASRTTEPRMGTRRYTAPAVAAYSTGTPTLPPATDTFSTRPTRLNTMACGSTL